MIGSSSLPACSSNRRKESSWSSGLPKYGVEGSDDILADNQELDIFELLEMIIKKGEMVRIKYQCCKAEECENSIVAHAWLVSIAAMHLVGSFPH